MKKKITILSLILSFLLIFGGVITYAYFYLNLDSKHSVSTDITNTSNVIEINDVKAFYDAIDYFKANDNSEFNNDSKTSLERKTLRLACDIQLTSNALITRDCHIDLNGHFIDLNGYLLNIKHSFDGVVSIYDATNGNGVIKDTKAKNNLVVDLPNASFVMDQKNLEGMTLEGITISPTGVLNSAMRFIYANIANTGINDFYKSTVDVIGAYDIAGCTMQHNADSNELLPCIYTYTDLDLIDHYYSYPIKISYLLGSTLLDKSLKINTSTPGDIVLTIKLELDAVSLIKDVHVHVLDDTSKLEASNLILNQYLSRYFNSKEQKYIFNGPILLPKKNSYLGTDYLYTVNDGKNDFTSAAPNDFFKSFMSGTNPLDYTIATISNTIKKLSITSSNKTGSKVKEYTNIVGNVDGGFDDKFTYCVNVAQDLFGNQILIKDDEKTNSKFTEVMLPQNVVELGYSQLESITYELVSNDDGTYAITDIANDPTNKLLKTTNPKGSATDPYLGQKVLLKMIFKFNADSGGVTKDLKLPIVYFVKSVDDGSSTLDNFTPYYVFFNNQFEKATNNFSYSSFDLPMFYERGFPTYSFLIYKKVTDGLGKISYEPISIDGPLFDVTIKNSVDTVGSKIDNFVSNSTSLKSYQTDVKSVTSITIDPKQIPELTEEYAFIYLPVYNISGVLEYRVEVPRMNKDGTQALDEKGNKIFDLVVAKSLAELQANTLIKSLNIPNYKYVSNLTVPGIVRYGATNEVFVDAALYQLIFETIYPGEPYNLNKYIEASKMSTGMSLNFSGSNNANVKTFKGIERLTGLKSLNFEGRLMSDRGDPSVKGNYNLNGPWVNEFNYIGNVPNLIELNLKNTGIYDKLQNGGLLDLPGNQTNGLLLKLSGLKKLERLDISNKDDHTAPLNQLYQFNGIEQLPSLKWIDVSNNVMKARGGLGILNSTMTNVINSTNGTSGGPNVGLTAAMNARGITVITGNKDVVIPKGTMAIVNALSSLQYQDKIEKTQDLSIAYAPYNDKDYSFFMLLYSYTDYIKNNSNEVETEIYYTFDSLKFENATDGSGFTFIISYMGRYKTHDGFWGGWGNIHDLNPDANNGNKNQPINYTYFYPVTRY